jgi:CHAT domain/SIR2-like domain
LNNIAYEDFNLSINPAKEDQLYRVQVVRSGGGDASGLFSLRDLDFSPKPGGESSASEAEPKAGRAVELNLSEEQLIENRAQPLTADDAREFGKQLFKSVFTEPLYVALKLSLKRAQAGLGLRLVLDLTNVPELAVLPWEFLCNDRTNLFLGQTIESPIVRYLHLEDELKPLFVDGPLRVLVMIADVPHLPKLDVEKEWLALKETVKELEEKGLIEIERLDEPTLPALQTRLTERMVNKPYHVFHFIGHGAFDAKGKGKLLIKQTGSNEVYPLTAERLSVVLRNHNKTLRLVVLNACEGARTSATESYTGIAQNLLKQGGIPAIIAMQYKISDPAAITFSREFYNGLASGLPVEAALSHARLAIFTDDNDVEWATPVLYLHASNGQLFNVKTEQPRRTASLPANGDGDGGHYQKVINALLEGKLVPFLGLDVNLYGRPLDPNWQPGLILPSSQELAGYLARTFSYPGEARDLPSISQYVVVSKKSSVDLYDNLWGIFSGMQTGSMYKPTPLHNFFAQLPQILREKKYPRITDKLRHRFIVVVSTYDNLLETAFQNYVSAYHVVSYVTIGERDGKFSHTKFASGGHLLSQPTLIDSPSGYQGLSDQDPIILKLPGTVEQFEQRFAITEDQFADYLTYKDLSGLLPPQIKSKLKGSHHLFLGSNLRDWHLRALLYRIWESRRPQSDSWAVDPNAKSLDQEFWKACGVEVIQADLVNYIDILEKGVRSVPPADDKS